MKELLTVLGCLLIPAAVLIPPIRRGEGRLSNRLKACRYEWAVYAALAVGFAVRLTALGDYPAGFNQDEASAAYDAYSILKTGYDRNGQFLPVHLIAWGSGQNALYSYLSIPFLAVFGLKVWAFRLPMALIGCLSLVAFWRLLLAIAGRKTGLIGLALLAVCPWHILKSRWALESNLFPDLVLFGVLFLVLGLKKNRLPSFLAGCGILGLSAYAYGTSYLFLPAFVLPLWIFLLWQKTCTFRRAGAGLGVLILVALPMILFVFVNTFAFETIRLPFMTIPRLPANRMAALASIFSGEFLGESLRNFAEAFKIAVTQRDGLVWNSMDGFGITYLFSLPFTVMGMLRGVMGRKEERPAFGSVMNAWFCAALVLTFVVEPNINRINALWIPWLYYTTLGVSAVAEVRRLFRTATAGLYTAAFLLFVTQYGTGYQEKMKTAFEDSFGEAVVYAAGCGAERVYVTDQVNGAYALTLFYTAEDPVEFRETAVIANPGAMFERVTSFGRFYFDTPVSLPEGSAAVVRNETAEQDRYASYQKTHFERFTVLENTT